jgi:hypothetical protein
MAGIIDTYFEARNATDDAERRALIERCLSGDVELIDENGREADMTDLRLVWPSSSGMACHRVDRTSQLRV